MCFFDDKRDLLLAFLGVSRDKEYLLLGDYSSGADEFQINYESSESEEVVVSPRNFSDAEDTSSDTDIDAAVKEYRERIQVNCFD